MTNSALLLNSALAATLLAGAPSVHADKGHDHARHAHPASDSVKDLDKDTTLTVGDEPNGMVIG